jgi:hypothetical protein
VRGKTQTNLRFRPAALARRVLNTVFTYLTIPVKLEEILASYDLVVARADLGDWSGVMFRPGPGRGGVVVINQNDYRGRQRFTAGHELWHYIWEKGNALYRRTRYDEICANRFAAELLMPRAPFISMWCDYREFAPNPRDRVPVVAHEFDVSPAAATVRVRSLRLMTMEGFGDVARPNRGVLDGHSGERRSVVVI